ncbi:uncharacterized protein [Atheta coriaria]|uniref:uncharacterized protein n=1 Tax=Dalotia coriaria TaxID=877792 RepID=UPI0031F46294
MSDNEVPCDILINLNASDEFRIPEAPKAKPTPPAAEFDGCHRSALLQGRPLLFDDGRESLGILPQFKLLLGNKTSHQFEYNTSDPFNTSSSSFFDPFINSGRPSLLYDGRESLGILPQCKNILLPHVESQAELECWLKSPTQPKIKAENLLQKFQKDCEAIENGDFQPDLADITDEENYSVYVEANFLASKLADNSILDISQEGGSILDRTPQPDFVEDGDSLNQSDKKVDTESVYKQVDLMLPPAAVDNSGNPDHDLPAIISDTARQINNRSDLLEHLSFLARQLEDNPRLSEIMQNAIKQISDLNESQDALQQPLSSVDEEDSGHSSTENEKELRACHVALDLSINAHSSESAHALDLSFSKGDVPKRLSITFSHKDDAGLPDKQPSNKLKQQTMHMRQLWGKVNTTAAAVSSDGSTVNNESKASSTGSMRVKLKPKKSEPQDLKRGPLKAVVPLTSLNTSLTMDCVASNRTLPTRRTPRANFTPMARSTPEELGGLADRRKQPQPGTPAGRPGKSIRVSAREKYGTPPTRCEKTLTRGKSSTNLTPHAAEASTKPVLRRCFSLGGKENLSTQQNHKSSPGGRTNVVSFSKLPQKVMGIKKL